MLRRIAVVLFVGCASLVFGGAPGCGGAEGEGEGGGEGEGEGDADEMTWTVDGTTHTVAAPNAFAEHGTVAGENTSSITLSGYDAATTDSCSVTITGVSGTTIPAGVYDCNFDPTSPPVVNVQVIQGGTVFLAQQPGECTVTLNDAAALGAPLSGSFTASAASAAATAAVSGSFSFPSTQ